MEKDILASVKFVGSNGKSVILPNIQVHIGPGSEDLDLKINEVLHAMIINLLEKQGEDYFAKKESHYKKYGKINREYQTFYTVEIEDSIVPRTGWREVIKQSKGPGAPMDDYTQKVDL